MRDESRKSGNASCSVNDRGIRFTLAVTDDSQVDDRNVCNGGNVVHLQGVFFRNLCAVQDAIASGYELPNAFLVGHIDFYPVCVCKFFTNFRSDFVDIAPANAEFLRTLGFDESRGPNSDVSVCTEDAYHISPSSISPRALMRSSKIRARSCNSAFSKNSRSEISTPNCVWIFSMNRVARRLSPPISKKLA